MHCAASIKKLLRDLKEAGEVEGFTVEPFAYVGPYPILGFIRPAIKYSASSRHIYLSAGIHGDEPAGPKALLELLQSGALPPDDSFYLCPLLNPSGMATGRRENPEGLDLNRDYAACTSREVAAHVKWIHRSITQVDYALHLHEDWESAGFYLYELNFTGLPGLADDLLAAVRAHLPIETATEIDGRSAESGIIRPKSLPALDDGDPESIFLQKKFHGLNYTLETPSSADFRKRVDALKAAVLRAF